MIPKIFHRTVRELGVEPYESYWRQFQWFHPGWQFITYTGGDIFMAGLTRLMALVRYGGIYVDWDVEPIRSWEPLLGYTGFAAVEPGSIVLDAVIGAVPNHPALVKCLDLAMARMGAGGNCQDTGPRVVAEVVTNRNDWTVLPFDTFYPYNWNELHRAGEDFSGNLACYGVHHWSYSWRDMQNRSAT
jgi:mannosyltransferase OCH1-like enzyme